MTSPASVRFVETDLDAIATAEGRVAVIVTPDGKLDPGGRRVNRLTRGALARLIEGGALDGKEAGDVITLDWPSGLAARALDVVVLPRNADAETSRRAGVALGRAKGDKPLTLLGGTLKRPAEVALGAVLRAYDFAAHKTGDIAVQEDIIVMVRDPGAAEAAFSPLREVAEGVFLTRDLVNAPANHLTTTAFVAEIEALSALGVKVTVLDEAEMERLGMGALLCVGQGSTSPSHLAVMEWQG
ncbi:MAG TPA: leucyl aminopeptidase, partial [Roseovarius sp.]|nr:leucyl aminopeptidase [Roseovarius sp.]